MLYVCYYYYYYSRNHFFLYFICSKNTVLLVNNFLLFHNHHKAHAIMFYIYKLFLSVLLSCSFKQPNTVSNFMTDDISQTILLFTFRQ